MMGGIRGGLQRYRQYVLLNRNLFVSIASAMAVSAMVSQFLFKGFDPQSNTTYTIAASYAVYCAVFGALHHHDNKAQYLAAGRLDWSRFQQDLAKMIVSVGAAEAVYIAARWSLQHYFLASGLEPYAASITAHSISAAVFAVAVNLGIKATRLFRERTGAGRVSQP
jgi:hypothetical protein